VFLEDVRVPRENLLDTLDRGWCQLHDTINVERIVNAAGAVGTGELVLDKASGYASEREVFGREDADIRPISFHNSVCPKCRRVPDAVDRREKLAERFTELLRAFLDDLRDTPSGHRPLSLPLAECRR
jgi:hypothetical protein